MVFGPKYCYIRVSKSFYMLMKMEDIQIVVLGLRYHYFGAKQQHCWIVSDFEACLKLSDIFTCVQGRFPSSVLLVHA